MESAQQFPIRLNPLIEQASPDRNPDKPLSYHCLVCGANVGDYNCNQALIAARPEGRVWDWWKACDNADCVYAYGEGWFPGDFPEWAISDQTKKDTQS